MPPARRSILETWTVKPFGPHHSFIRSGSVKALQTRSRGALSTREMTNSELLEAASLITGHSFVADAASGSLSAAGVDHDHPVDAELVGNHAEFGREEGLDQRLVHLAAIGECREHALALA